MGNNFKMPFFSIVVPIYKVEQYLDQCINSVLTQTFIDYELILVDDGSPDGCPKKCDIYAESDSRIKVIHKENGGLSSARNAGIKVAVGQYLLFLDSDDFWETSEDLYRLHCIIQTSNNAQIIVFALKYIYPNGKVFDDHFCFDDGYLPEGKVTLRNLVCRDWVVGSACAKAIKRDFLVENDLFFVEGLKSEDIEWTLRICTLLPSYYYYNKHFYMYRQMREGSIGNTVDVNHLNQYLKIVSNFCNNKQIDKEVKEILYNYVAYHLSILCALAYNLPDRTEKKLFIRQIKEYSWLFNCNLMPKMKKISLLFHVFGFEITVIFLGLYLKIRKQYSTNKD